MMAEPVNKTPRLQTQFIWSSYKDGNQGSNQPSFEYT